MRLTNWDLTSYFFPHTCTHRQRIAGQCSSCRSSCRSSSSGGSGFLTYPVWGCLASLAAVHTAALGPWTFGRSPHPPEPSSSSLLYELWETSHPPRSNGRGEKEGCRDPVEEEIDGNSSSSKMSSLEFRTKAEQQRNERWRKWKREK